MPIHTTIAITELGKIDAIQVETGTPGNGEILLKTEYSSMVAFDTYMTDHGRVNGYPSVLGLNASGTVAQVGPDVTDLAVGDRVRKYPSLGSANGDHV